MRELVCFDLMLLISTIGHGLVKDKVFPADLLHYKAITLGPQASTFFSTEFLTLRHIMSCVYVEKQLTQQNLNRYKKGGGRQAILIKKNKKKQTNKHKKKNRFPTADTHEPM